MGRTSCDGWSNHNNAAVLELALHDCPKRMGEHPELTFAECCNRRSSEERRVISRGTVTLIPAIIELCAFTPAMCLLPSVAPTCRARRDRSISMAAAGAAVRARPDTSQDA